MFFGEKIIPNKPFKLKQIENKLDLNLTRVSLDIDADKAYFYLLKKSNSQVLLAELNRQYCLLSAVLDILVSPEDQVSLLVRGGSVHICGNFRTKNPPKLELNQDKSQKPPITIQNKKHILNAFEKVQQTAQNIRNNQNEEKNTRNVQNQEAQKEQSQRLSKQKHQIVTSQQSQSKYHRRSSRLASQSIQPQKQSQSISPLGLNLRKKQAKIQKQSQKLQKNKDQQKITEQKTNKLQTEKQTNRKSLKSLLEQIENDSEDSDDSEQYEQESQPQSSSDQEEQEEQQQQKKQSIQTKNQKFSDNKLQTYTKTNKVVDLEQLKQMYQKTKNQTLTKCLQLERKAGKGKQQKAGVQETEKKKQRPKIQIVEELSDEDIKGRKQEFYKAKWQGDSEQTLGQSHEHPNNSTHKHFLSPQEVDSKIQLLSQKIKTPTKKPTI